MREAFPEEFSRRMCVKGTFPEAQGHKWQDRLESDPGLGMEVSGGELRGNAGKVRRRERRMCTEPSILSEKCRLCCEQCEF